MCNAAARPGRPGGLTCAESVDQLSGDVRVSGVSSRLLDHVNNDPTQRRWSMVRFDLIVKTCAVPHPIGVLPRRGVRRDQVTHRMTVTSDEAGPARVSGE